MAARELDEAEEERQVEARLGVLRHASRAPLKHVALVFSKFFIDRVSQPGCILGRVPAFGIVCAGKPPSAAGFHRLTCILTRNERRGETYDIDTHFLL